MKEYTIDLFHKEMESGNVTSEKLVTWYLERINEIDKSGPQLNSVIEINPDALEIAKKLDGEFQKSNKKVGPLHGVPILIKDNIDTFDKMETTAGSISILRHAGKVKKDAFVVKRLRDAGAVILGKTNLSEMANFRGKRSISGWSSRGGQTKNPYVLNRNPSGSSSGSGVAVAANLCMVAIGTETDGSVTSPSNNNGIVGLKPTVGVVSRSGIIPIAHTQDTAGPMGRTVSDVAVVQSVITGYDEEDEATKLIKEFKTQQPSGFLKKNSLKGKKLGVFRSNFNFHRDVDKIMESVLETLTSLGADLIDPVSFDIPESLPTDEFNTLLYEYYFDLIKYFSTRSKSEISGAKELVQFNFKYTPETLEFFGQEHLEKTLEANELEEEYNKAKQTYEELANNISKMFEENKLDAIIYPTGNPAWLTDTINGDSHYVSSSTQYPAVTGYPHITVPMGYVDQLPVGLSIVGLPLSENNLLAFAYAFEQKTNIRVPPKFLEQI